MTTYRIKYVIDCQHCDGIASSTTLDTGQPDDGTLEIDIELSVAQSAFTCDRCGCRFFTGDIEVSAENEECPDDEDDETCDECGDLIDECACDEDATEATS